MAEVAAPLLVDEMFYRLEVSALHEGNVIHVVHLAAERDFRFVREGRWTLLAYLFADLESRMLQRAPDIDRQHLLYEITPATWCGLSGGFTWLEPDEAAARGFGLGL